MDHQNETSVLLTGHTFSVGLSLVSEENVPLYEVISVKIFWLFGNKSVNFKLFFIKKCIIFLLRTCSKIALLIF